MNDLRVLMFLVAALTAFAAETPRNLRTTIFNNIVQSVDDLELVFRASMFTPVVFVVCEDLGSVECVDAIDAIATWSSISLLKIPLWRIRKDNIDNAVLQYAAESNLFTHFADRARFNSLSVCSLALNHRTEYHEAYSTDELTSIALPKVLGWGGWETH